MARPKKNIENESKEILSSEEDVKFAVDLANRLGFAMGLYPGVYTPMLTNSRMKDVTLVQTQGVTSESVAKALDNPKETEDQLLAISEKFEYSSTPYKRLLSYMANSAAFDLTYALAGEKDTHKYDKDMFKDDKYKKDLDIVRNFLSKFDYRKEFQTALKQMYRQETFYSILRDEGTKYTLQELPSNYCMITGRWDYGLLFSYNYVYFLQAGIDIDLYPPIFKSTYNKLFGERNERLYNPSLPVDARGNNTWVMWGDCSPIDGFWAWKLQPAIATRIPYFSGMFPDLANQDFIRALQKSSYAAEAIKLLAGQVQMLDKTQKSSLRDAYSQSPETLAKFLQLMRSAINNDAVSIAAAPLDNINGIEYKANNKIQSDYIRTTLGSSGTNSNLLYSGGDFRMNQTETMLSTNVDELVSQEIYPFFNNFLDYHINKLTKKYDFKFRFEGSNLYTDRQRRLDAQITLMSQGIVNPQKIFAAIGQDPFEAQSQLDEAKAMGWVDKLTPIVPAAQQSAPNGRPTKSEDDLSESGEETRSQGSNISKGGKQK